MSRSELPDQTKAGKKLGVFVGEHGNWSFFHEAFEDLDKIYRTRVFRERTYHTPLLYGRLNRWAFRNGIRSILRSTDVNFFEWASELLVEATRIPKRGPIVTRLHSYELHAWAPKVNWSNVDRIILVSNAMKRRFCDLYPSEEHKTRVVYNGSRTDLFKPDPGREFRGNIGMLCRIVPIKRVYEIVMMLRELLDRGCNAHLYIGGNRDDGPNMDEYFVALHKLVEKMNLGDSVTFSGQVSDAASWLRGIDVYISNSYWEGQQVALLEAMASGCASYSHFWDGSEEVLPEEYIYASENNLLDKLVDYWSSTNVQKEAARSRMRSIAVEKFDIERTKAGIRAALADLT